MADRRRDSRGGVGRGNGGGPGSARARSSPQRGERHVALRQEGEERGEKKSGGEGRQRMRTVPVHPSPTGDRRARDAGSRDDVWTRVAADVTHIDGVPYLSTIDCGPSRFAYWKRLNTETAETLVKELLSVFLAIGPPGELPPRQRGGLSFPQVPGLLRLLKVKLHFRGSDEAQGNAIVERCH